MTLTGQLLAEERARARSSCMDMRASDEGFRTSASWISSAEDSGLRPASSTSKWKTIASRGSPLRSWTSFEVVPVAPNLCDEPDVAFASLLEQEDPASLGLVIAKRPVRPNKLHATDLPLAGVQEDAIGSKPVLVSVLVSIIPGE